MIIDLVSGRNGGTKAIPRTEVTKKLWAYIKRNGLQDKKKRTMINADDKLKFDTTAPYWILSRSMW